MKAVFPKLTDTIEAPKAIWLTIAILVAIPLLFISTSQQIVRVWTINETFTHGFLILPIVIWLVWRQRREVSNTAVCPDYVALCIVLPSLFIWYLAAVFDVQVAKQFSLIVCTVGSVWLLLGRRIVVKLAFPLGFLFFAVPAGQELIPPMMRFTAASTVMLVEASGIPVFREGFYFYLPSGNWSVVEECSGVRYLIASVSLGSLFAHISFSSFHKRALFIVAAIVVPILANILRAYGIVMIGHLSGMELATGVDHLLYGWIFFGLVFFLMIFVGSRWSDDPQWESSDRGIRVQGLSKQTIGKPGLLVATILVVLFVSVQSLASAAQRPPVNSTDPKFDSLPQKVGSFVWRADAHLLDWAPQTINADAQETRFYVSTDGHLRLDIAWYAYQRDGAEAASSINRVAEPIQGEWTIIRQRSVDNHSVTEFEMGRGADRVLVWRWYTVGASITKSPVRAKLLGVWSFLDSGRRDASMVTIATPIDTTDLSRERLATFFAEIERPIHSAFDTSKTRGKN